ncbi:MAG: TIGR00341 family protein [Candidatus Dadabacteria bacterium]|nr:TIGR00341 family protein [Candidatus Dadabacteria bacterium]NIS09096.1 TIGR00341 family protein [Candidatus Dadabacteria bacterium]NIV41532.1 TIGR00341 family protein [Candidatus Dadabacteria bacterium]NIX15213.1 TIGR00341 family protein [Candidatus Dadabacteria bacterium]NIY21857.1 TIGR00341 family protein [Candidatus Dadabacteria bacterium]
MALRLIGLYLPTKENIDWLKEKLSEYPVHGIWSERVSEQQYYINILISSENSGEILDLLENTFSTVDGFRIILLPVEATIPKVEEKKKEDNKNSDKKKDEDKKIGKGISRQELYTRISKDSKLSGFFIFMVIVSSILASIGILNGNIAVIIGAMVIAPLLGPNVALALATTLGDLDLLKNCVKSNLTGILVALIFSLILGFLLNDRLTMDTDLKKFYPELYSRTQVGMGDIALALASGSAGALSFTMGLPSALIGVMVAVALLPPLVTFGMLLGSGLYDPALGAVLLLSVNIICVNLAGVATFLFQGVRPRTWWEASRAKRSSIVAIIIWTVLLVILMLIISQIKNNFLIKFFD